MNNAVKYWTWTTYRNAHKFTKRFVVYSYSWWWPEYEQKHHGNGIADPYSAYKTNEYAEFDTIDEANEFIKYSQEIYKDVEKPIFIKKHWVDRVTGKKQTDWPYGGIKDYDEIANHYECDDGKRKFIGYLIFDYLDEVIVKMVGDKHPDFIYKSDYSRLEALDYLFRKPGEIPEDYEWDSGEYDGWLQFRWGNGLNAIDKEDEINRRKKEESRKQREKLAKEKEDFKELFDIDEEGD